MDQGIPRTATSRNGFTEVSASGTITTTAPTSPVDYFLHPGRAVYRIRTGVLLAENQTS